MKQKCCIGKLCAFFVMNKRIIYMITAATIVFALGFFARCHQIYLTDEVYINNLHDADNREIASTKWDVDLRPISTLTSVKKNLEEYYVEKLTQKDETKMSHEAIDYMLSELKDPYTRFYDKKTHKAILDTKEGIFDGIGASFLIKQTKNGEKTDEHLIIIGTRPHSPAENAGLVAGDEICEINDSAILSFNPFTYAEKLISDARNNRGDRKQILKDFEKEQKRIANGKTMNEAMDMLRLHNDKELSLKIKTSNGSEKNVKLSTKKMTVEPVSCDYSKGYIKINYISEKTIGAFYEAMKKTKTKTLTLDMKNVSGGSIDAAKYIAQYFIPNKTLAVIKHAHRNEEIIKAEADKDKLWDKNVEVIVNKGTYNVAEILVEALRQNPKVKIIGSETYGDGTLTLLFENTDKTSYSLNSGEILTYSKQSIKDKGLTIDEKK